MSADIHEFLDQLCSRDSVIRESAAGELFRAGVARANPAIEAWLADCEFSALLGKRPEATVGVAVSPERFDKIRAANGSPRLADVPPDQDALEFELNFGNGVRLDVLTSHDPGKSGAIAKFLKRFGEGVQQVEFRCHAVGRATQILREKFNVSSIYPETRAGAGATRVNFFLVSSPSGEKVLIELYEPAGSENSPC